MDRMPLLAVILYSIPESVILFSFGVAIVGEYIKFKKIFIASVILAFSSMLVRSYVTFYGLHSVIGIFVLFVLFWKLLKLKPWKAIISSIISLMALAALESIILPIILKSQNLTLEELWKDNYRRIVYGYSSLIVYGLMTWFLYSKKIFLIRESRVDNDDKYNKARLLVTLIILFQGIFLIVINERLLYFNKYSLVIILLYIIFFVSSILFLKRLYGGDELKKAQNRDKT